MARNDQEKSNHSFRRSSERDSQTTRTSGVIGFTAIFMAIFALFFYAKTPNPTVLYFAGFVILMALGLPPLIDFLKSAALKGMDKELEQSGDWKKSMERIENLEALMCRLDAEINLQLEQSLSGGKITTLENINYSQAPTVFLNIASSLEKRFQILREIGRGGMGIVFQAHDKQLNEQVAIKILSPLLSHNSDALERLKREVSAARRITHPNVIRIHDISEAEGIHFVSMEYFAGDTLKDFIRKKGACSPALGIQIAFQICDGLEGAHRQGVIHRDLKSQNIILNEAGELKIIDFGLASVARLEGMTATGLILGTPEYMSPEQVAGKRADERSDIYSLGVILYEIFTGKVPFTGDSAIAVGFQQLREEPSRPTEVNSNIPSAIEGVILKALAKDPAKRHASVSEMRGELEKTFHFKPAVSSEKTKHIESREVITSRRDT